MNSWFGCIDLVMVISNLIGYLWRKGSDGIHYLSENGVYLNLRVKVWLCSTFLFLTFFKPITSSPVSYLVISLFEILIWIQWPFRKLVSLSTLMFAGKVCKIEKPVSQHAVERSVIFAAQYGQPNLFFRKSLGLRLNCSSPKISCSTFLHAMTRDGKILKPPVVYTDETAEPRLPFVQSTISWPRRKCSCYPRCTAACILTSGTSWLQCQKSRHVKVNRTSANYKSNDFDITKGDVDALAWAEGSGDALFIEGNEQIVSPWWERFPKRWVIVLLCFFAFLLCNMDRVSTLPFPFYWHISN